MFIWFTFCRLTPVGGPLNNFYEPRSKVIKVYEGLIRIVHDKLGLNPVTLHGKGYPTRTNAFITLELIPSTR